MLPESEPLWVNLYPTDIGLDKDYIEQKKSSFNYVTIEEAKTAQKRVAFCSQR